MDFFFFSFNTFLPYFSNKLVTLLSDRPLFSSVSKLLITLSLDSLYQSNLLPPVNFHNKKTFTISGKSLANQSGFVPGFNRNDDTIFLSYSLLYINFTKNIILNQLFYYNLKRIVFLFHIHNFTALVIVCFDECVHDCWVFCKMHWEQNFWIAFVDKFIHTQIVSFL